MIKAINFSKTIITKVNFLEIILLIEGSALCNFEITCSSNVDSRLKLIQGKTLVDATTNRMEDDPDFLDISDPFDKFMMWFGVNYSILR